MRIPAIVLFLLSLVSIPASSEPVRLDGLTQGQQVHGFRAEAVYLNDADRPMGARFVHRRTGFTLDLLQIESVPQAFTWVQTTPVSDQGEPHTQEHLLLGKGTTGRAFSGLDTMWLASSSAFTRQRETAYHFNTAAGPDVFFRLFERQLDALLHPNYSDEEIRREVCHFGVTRQADGTRHLEEKGTVYNEMVSSTTSAGRAVYRAVNRLVYGEGHPLFLNSGGEPAGIRTMKAADIRTFHRDHYFLANMGTIAALPQSLGLAEILTRLDATLTRVEPARQDRAPQPHAALPAPKGAAPGAITYPEYPHKNERQPSPLWFYWPATRQLGPDEFTRLELFLNTIAGDATTNLYKLFVDSRTRRLETGARSVSAGVNWEGGQPIGVYLQDVAPENFTDERITEIRRLITDEIERVASFADGSPELAELNERLSSNLLQSRRAAVKFVDSPPGFGIRGTTSSWLEHITQLAAVPGFRKSVTWKPQLALVQREIESGKNVWRDWLTRWQIRGVAPYAVAARPQPQLLDRLEAERAERATAEAARLAQGYGLEDVQEALRRYETAYEAASAQIEEAARGVTPPPLAESLPMTLDDPLRFETRTLEGGVPVVASHFENMSSGTVGMALRLDGVSREHLRYVALLPALLSRVGVIENGRPVSYEEMTQRLRREILSLNASLSTNARTERVELVVRGSGLGLEEMRRALGWMSLILHSPDWRPENLPRLRDLVDQMVSGLRSTTQGSEESWVGNPQTAYWRQRNPLMLSAASFLTTTHDALRLKWRLRDPNADGQAVAPLLDSLAPIAKGLTRDELKARLAQPALLSSLAPSAREIATEALKDLDLALIDVPDGSLAADWAYLCTALRDDLLMPPADVLAALEAMRRSVLKTGGARLFVIGSPALEKEIAPDVAALVARLETAPVPRKTSGEVPLVDVRVRERDPSALRPVHLGLFMSAKPGGVIITSAPFAHYADHADREKLLDFLAANLYSGSGAHGIFLKTIGAGLAYSNGVGASLGTARLSYYAERTPELAQTVRFVVQELKRAPPLEGLGDYVVAQVFTSRASTGYESRGEALASDLANGQSPDLIRKFREAVLALRKEPDFTQRLLARKDAVYAPALPGYADRRTAAADTFSFAIGPEKQLASWQEYLTQAEGADAKLYRLYGRDFWQP